MRHYLMGGMVLIAALLAALSCSSLDVGSLTGKAKGMMDGNKDKQNDTSPPAPAAQPPPPQPAPQQPPPMDARAQGGPAGGMAGMGSNCMVSTSTREEASKCWRNYGDQLQETGKMCRQRADSGMYEKDKDKYEKCAAQSGQATNAFYCVADDILKPGTQMDAVQKACFDKYKIEK
jgi:hypothetical protein